MPGREAQIVVCKVLHREIVDADRLLVFSTALNLLHKFLLDLIVVIEVAADGLTILLGDIFDERLLKLVVVYSMARLIPHLIHVLHVPAKAAKLRKELALVQVPLPILVVRLDSWPSIKAFVGVGLDLVNRQSELLIVAQPLVSLILNLVLLNSIAERDELESLLALHALIVSLGEEEDLYV